MLLLPSRGRAVMGRDLSLPRLSPANATQFQSQQEHLIFTATWWKAEISDPQLPDGKTQAQRWAVVGGGLE